MVSDSHEFSLAIVGLAGKFPGAATAEQFWERLRNGEEGIQRRGAAGGVSGTFVPAVSKIGDAECFDAGFFGVSARDAELMDPQHRKFLEVSYQALEHAGYVGSAPDLRVGVYAGCSLNTYFLQAMVRRRGLQRTASYMELAVLNQTDFLATRVAYHLGLTGPALVIQTACSTSLVTVHAACQALLAGECDLAIAGGASISVGNEAGYDYELGGILSPDGFCRPFDEHAEGTVKGDGIAAIVLKRYRRALEDGDTVHAVIRGTAVNNDGSRKATFTAPGVAGQARAVTEALAMAGVDAREVTLIEAHGTGTKLGDPIELDALKRVFGTGDGRPPCTIGSVKSNIGHLDAAAGIAGLIKVVLALKNKQIPPTLHWTAPNPELRLHESPFVVQRECIAWKPPEGGRRIAGVSSFGIGGTNAHVVLEEAPPEPARPDVLLPQLFPVSGRTPEALKQANAELVEYVRHLPPRDLGAAAYTYALGKQPYRYRRACVYDPKRRAWHEPGTCSAPATASGAEPSVIFLFSGHGGQYPGVARDLYERGGEFSRVLDVCAGILKSRIGFDIREPLLGTGDDALGTMLHDIRHAQPILFSLEYALARQFMDWGIRPSALIGHSLGEYVAACVAGVVALSDALAIVSERGRLLGLSVPGRMVAVEGPVAELETWLPEGAHVAGVNAPGSFTVSGSPDAIQQLSVRLEAAGIACHELHAEHPYHTPLLRPVAAEFEQLLRGIDHHPPQVPVYSNVLARPMRDGEYDPRYWGAHLCEPVRFEQCVRAALKNEGPEAVFLELGPGRSLCNFVARLAGEGIRTLASLPHARERLGSGVTAAHALGTLWSAGAPVAWERYHAENERRRVPTPSYPFQKTRYWILDDVQEHPTEAMHADKPEAPVNAPARSVDREFLQAAYLAPQTDVQRSVTDLWEAFLGCRGIGVRDNFFELGGNSLIALRILSRINERFGTTLKIATIFDRATVADLCSVLPGGVDREEAPKSLRKAELPETIPLSFGQQRLWFLDKYLRQRSAYYLPATIRVKGNVDLAALQRAVDRLVDRHEVLRTIFEEVDGAPRQVVRPSGSVRVRHVDWTGLPDAELPARVQQAESEALPFELDTGPLLTIAAYETAPGAFILAFNMHHIVSDGWSMALLIDELTSLYVEETGGPTKPLEPLPLQYADYAIRQREVAAQARDALAFWREALADAPPLLSLPTDRPRPAVQSYRGAQVRFEFPIELARGLHRMAADRRVTLFMLLQAAFTALLYRYSGQRDLCVGTPVAGRGAPELEGLIGFFVDTLVLRNRIDPSHSFEDFLLHAKDVALQAYAHQDVPFEQLVEELKPQRSLSYSPLFQVMFVLQNAPRGVLRVPGLELELLPSSACTSKFDLAIYLMEQGDAISGYCEFSTDLFDEATIRRLVGHYEVLLGGILAAPETSIADLPLLTAAEEREVVKDWNATEADYPYDMTVHQCFEEQVRKDPQAIALVFEGEQLSYAELNARSNQLARHLRRRGVGPETLVGICAERSLDMVIALVAVLKAGGAYVPMDPAYPQERLAFMLQDAAPALLLTQERLLVQFGQCNTPLLCLDRDWPQVAVEAQGDLECVSHADHLAYVIYTSGSTGHPKGVLTPHRGVVNYLDFLRRVHGIGPGDRILNISSISFDPSTRDIFGPLISGATLCVPGSLDSLDPHAIATALRKQSISHVFSITPSFLDAVLTEPAMQQDPPRALKLLMTCGEHLRPRTVRLARSVLGQGFQLVNQYGPTEVTMVASSFVVENDKEILIGRPISNKKIRVLDAHLRPVPVGVAGEIHVGGTGLARGYLHRPELTRERFVPDPWAPGERLYRTGDIGVLTETGAIRLVGRTDNQVKLRGIRLELGEVEAVLSTHPGVSQAVVTLHDTAQGAILVAFVTEEAPSRALTSAALKQHAAARLPLHAVPGRIEIVDAIPLTPSGKVDRSQLRWQGELRVRSEPATELEERIRTMWCELLDAQDVGVEDDFFASGGHSLLAVKLLSRLRRELDVQLSVRQIFGTLTVRALAGVVETQQRTAGSARMRQAMEESLASLGLVTTSN